MQDEEHPKRRDIEREYYKCDILFLAISSFTSVLQEN